MGRDGQEWEAWRGEGMASRKRRQGKRDGRKHLVLCDKIVQVVLDIIHFGSRDLVVIEQPHDHFQLFNVPTRMCASSRGK